VFDVLREESHRRIDDSPTCAESHMGIDLQPPGGRRSPILENLVDRGSSMQNDEPTEHWVAVIERPERWHHGLNTLSHSARSAA
jgi:hypothetical protein